jgi:hypothetical protein
VKRTNISITDDQHEFLRQEAHRRRVSIARLIRIFVNKAIQEAGEKPAEEQANDAI